MCLLFQYFSAKFETDQFSWSGRNFRIYNNTKIIIQKSVNHFYKNTKSSKASGFLEYILFQFIFSHNTGNSMVERYTNI